MRSPTHKTHRSHVSGSKRGARYAARKKDRLVKQVEDLKRELASAHLAFVNAQDFGKEKM